MQNFNFKMWTIGISITMLMVLSTSTKCQIEAAVQSRSSASSPETLSSSEPIRIKMLTPSTVSKKHTRTRQNSRFLRTFPRMELLNLAKQSVMDNEIAPMMSFPGSGNRNGYQNRNSLFREPPSMSYGNPYPMKARIDAGNSPIFYIKLPPVPYVFMPGYGYVSPHPYSNAPSMPMMGSGPDTMSGLGSFLPQGQEMSSMEQQAPSVISLPLKFLSNGRPHQIESNKKRKRPGNKENSSESKGATLISGGKYSFNGRPTAVFVVRSPAGSIEKRK